MKKEGRYKVWHPNYKKIRRIRSWIMEVSNSKRCLIIPMKYQKKEDKSLASFYTKFSNSKTSKPSTKDPSSSKKSMSTKANGKTMREMAEEPNNGKAEVFIKATGKITLHTAMVDWSMLTVMCT
jgi:hypothetical protein